MTNFLHSLSIWLDLLKKRYQTFLVKSDDDIGACLEVLDKVRRKELNRVTGNSVLDSHAFATSNLSYQLMACRDTRSQKIIGCIRMTPAREAVSIPSSKEEYLLDIFDSEQINRLTIFTRLAVLKEYRKSPAALLLMVFSFKRVLDNGGHGILMSCEPNLLPLYKRMGLRTIGPMHNSPSGGYRIPMICIPDKKYYQSIKSPAFRFFKNLDFSKYEKICRWYHDFEKKHPDLEVGASLYQSESDLYLGHKMITEGLTAEGRISFLKNAVELKCKQGDIIIAEKDGGKAFGFVKSGEIEVVLENDVKVRLREGEIFGEIAFVLDRQRSAKVVAFTDVAEVVMFSQSALERLEQEKDKKIIWRNLARILAERILRTNRLLD
jgi:DNA-binding Xre family transcriptional regulator